MTTARITEADIRLRGAVVRQLDWDPEVDVWSYWRLRKGWRRDAHRLHRQLRRDERIRARCEQFCMGAHEDLALGLRI